MVIINILRYSLQKILGKRPNTSSLEKGLRKHSYSQCGEDLIIDYVFKLRGISMPSYIDIGAHDPYFLNNTAIFYQRGCRGINIEANPYLINNFNHFRPKDTNINIGISNVPGELDFYIMTDSTLSTFSKTEYYNLIENNKTLLETRRIPLTTVKSILEKYCGGMFPDFLNIDVEGLDLQIIQSINFTKSAPKIICVEAAEYSPVGAGARRNDLIDFLKTQGYYEYANTNLNAILVKKDFWFN